MEGWIPSWFISLNWFLACIPCIAFFHYIILHTNILLRCITTTTSSSSLPSHDKTSHHHHHHHPQHYIIIHHLTKLTALSISITLVLGIALEIYYLNKCPNSLPFRTTTHETATTALGILNDLSVPHWLMFGNLLFALRNRTESIPSSDTDVDVAVLSSDFHPAVFQSLEERLNERNYGIRKAAGRELYQITKRGITLPGPRFDIWVYSEADVRIASSSSSSSQALSLQLMEDTTLTSTSTSTSTLRVVQNLDYTIRDPKLPIDRVFPLRPIRYLNASTSLPNRAETVARMEYGANYMTPVTTRLECAQNVTNGYCFYDVHIKWKGAFLGFVISGVCGLYRILIGRLSGQQRQQSSGKKWDDREV
mmetsp:Transcript_20225/g.38140  ORF Transcript_20225/g.38140 Transcript_20225/m.38140 type:complete len:365 (+) Transcript_20225:53-1147(+)